MELNQYTIAIVNLDPTIGSEIRKTTPCVVVSPNEMNKYLKTIIVAHLTTSTKDYPTRVKVEFQNKERRIAIDQFRTIDKNRITKLAGELSKKEVVEVKDVINRTLVL